MGDEVTIEDESLTPEQQSELEGRVERLLQQEQELQSLDSPDEQDTEDAADERTPTHHTAIVTDVHRVPSGETFPGQTGRAVPSFSRSDELAVFTLELPDGTTEYDAVVWPEADDEAEPLFRLLDSVGIAKGSYANIIGEEVKVIKTGEDKYEIDIPPAAGVGNKAVYYCRRGLQRSGAYDRLGNIKFDPDTRADALTTGFVLLPFALIESALLIFLSNGSSLNPVVALALMGICFVLVFPTAVTITHLLIGFGSLLVEYLYRGFRRLFPEEKAKR